MEIKYKKVLARLSDVFLIDDYFSLDTPTDIEQSLISFYVDLATVGVRDKTIGSLIALLAAGHAKIWFVDGYHENVFYRCQALIGTLLRQILGDGLTKSLLSSSIIYRKIKTNLELQNTYIELTQEGEHNNETVINLSLMSWKDYIKNTYPDMYAKKYQEYDKEYEEILN
tara:strand:+ start:1373 stop:1882 length:510 start_codon:yes stop_codon:yes gene_type:complete